MFKQSLAAVAALCLAATPLAAQAPTYTINLVSFAYAPQPIQLRAGQPVTLNFVNRSNSGHDFTARSFFANSRIIAGAVPGGKVRLGPGGTQSVTLVPRAGDYGAHCSHFLHSQFGMRTRIYVR